MWLQLLFHPSNGMSGMYYFPIATLEDFTGYKNKIALDIFDDLIKSRWIVYDSNGSLLWLRNQLRFDPYKPLLDPKKRQAIVKHLYSLPRSSLILDFIEDYHLHVEQNARELLDKIAKVGATPEPLRSPFEGSSDVGLRKSDVGLRKSDSRRGRNRMSVKQRTPLASNGFTAFWGPYPRKKNKVAAEKAWLQLDPDDELSQRIVDDVEKKRNCHEWTKGKKDPREFVPYPASYLNGRRWEDEDDDLPPDPTDRNRQGLMDWHGGD